MRSSNDHENNQPSLGTWWVASKSVDTPTPFLRSSRLGRLDWFFTVVVIFCDCRYDDLQHVGLLLKVRDTMRPLMMRDLTMTSQTMRFFELPHIMMISALRTTRYWTVYRYVRTVSPVLRQEQKIGFFWARKGGPVIEIFSLTSSPKWKRVLLDLPQDEHQWTCGM